MASPGSSDAEGTASLAAVPRFGLSLAALLDFAAAHAGSEYTVSSSSRQSASKQKLPFERLTTAQVVEAVILPATRRPDGRTCSYAELLLEQVRIKAASLRSTARRARVEA